MVTVEGTAEKRELKVMLCGAKQAAGLRFETKPLPGRITVTDDGGGFVATVPYTEPMTFSEFLKRVRHELRMMRARSEMRQEAE